MIRGEKIFYSENGQRNPILMKHWHKVAIGAVIAIAAATTIFNNSNAGILPNPSLTPGATNPDITQVNIGQTLCNPSWSTKSIRPPSSYTTRLKVQQLAQGYAINGDTNPADYEEDHFISLELGGNPTDPRNLWPESYKTTPSARDKDQVENYLHQRVCAGQLSLSAAQQEISGDWTKVIAKMRNARQSFGSIGGDLDDE